MWIAVRFYFSWWRKSYGYLNSAESAKPDGSDSPDCISFKIDSGGAPSSSIYTLSDKMGKTVIIIARTRDIASVNFDFRSSSFFSSSSAIFPGGSLLSNSRISNKMRCCWEYFWRSSFERTPECVSRKCGYWGHILVSGQAQERVQTFWESSLSGSYNTSLVSRWPRSPSSSESSFWVSPLEPRSALIIESIAASSNP